MQDKENVYENIPQTEQGWKMDGADGASVEKKGSADLGKFKDVNALLQAYHSLQAEFTRRSQRLKRYEDAEKDNRERAQAQDTDAADGQLPTADAPTELHQEADSARPDSPIEENVKDEESQPQAQPIERAAEEKKQETATQCEGISATHSAAKEQETLSLYERAASDESVRLKIVGDYLSSIGKSGAPLIKGGSGVLASPMKSPQVFSRREAWRWLTFERARKRFNGIPFSKASKKKLGE